MQKLALEEVPDSQVAFLLDGIQFTRLHLLILLTCGIAFSFDLAELAFGSILSAVFSAAPYSASSWQLGWLLGAVYVGAIAGAPLLGWLADLYGRRIVLVCLMGLLSLASIASAMSPNIQALVGSRVMGGIALGAYPPLMFALLTDVLPTGRRGGLITTCTAIGYVGPPALIFLVRALTPSSPIGLEAWRIGFLVAALGAFACSALFWLLPESARWLLAQGRMADASHVIERFKRSPSIRLRPHRRTQMGSITRTHPERSLLRTALGLMTIYFVTPWATVGFTLLSGAVLIQKGISVQDSLLYVGLSNFGPIIATLSVGVIVDRINRRLFLVGCATAMALAGIAFAISDRPLWIVLSGLSFNMIVALFLPILVLYAAEAVPSQARARVTTFAWAANRLGSAIVPLVLLPILRVYGQIPMFSVIAATLMLFIAMLILDDRNVRVSAEGRGRIHACRK